MKLLSRILPQAPVDPNKKKRAPLPLWLKWGLCLLPGVLAAALYLLLPHTPGFAEWGMVRGAFRVLGFPLEWLVSLLPFSLMEVAVVLGIPAVLIVLVVWIVRIVRTPHRRLQIAEKGCRFIAWCGSLALLVFMIMDGAAFSRQPLAELMELPEGEYTVKQLYKVTIDLAQKASDARERITEDEEGCMVLSNGIYKTLAQADDCYHPLIEEYPFLRTGTWQVKPVALSHLWSYTGFTGMYCPWLGEANVNVDITPAEIGETAAHEIAHTMGFAKENECNFLAYLACSHSDNPDYVYSGYLAAFIHCVNELGDHKPDWVKAAYKYCSDGMVRDIRQRSAYWKQFAGKTMETSQKVNDTFIKVNGVASGRISYGEMVELVLRYYDQQDWI